MAPLAAITALAVTAITRPPVLRAATPWEPPPCADAGPPGAPGAAWYRLDGTVDAGGTLVGQRLTTGLIGGAERYLDLPPESFATGPWDGVVLVGADDGSRSRLSLLDVRRGCRRVIADERAVVRSALLAPDGASIVEHRVDRRTREDLGVWRRPLAGGRSRRIVPGVAADRRYGPTFSTGLRWAPNWRLAVTSCGELACRTRLIDVRSGRLTTVGPTGPVIGVADGDVVAHAICPGYPCAVLRYGAGGRLTMLAPDAGRAAMAGMDVVVETMAGGLSAVDVSSGRTRPVRGGADRVPLDRGSGARSGVDAPDEAIVVARRDGVDPDAVVVTADDEAIVRGIPAVRP